ncbi:MAG: insulinase family protein [Gammaproteobacteria bacterium]|nr:insulinase family protein [Gammaproteobacteria bacterium]
MKFILLPALLAFTLSLPAAATTPISEFQLDNGMKLLVRPDHRAPVVVSQIWYKVGSSYEPGGITGISHVLEHMMFKGTERRPAGEFSSTVSVNGGRENAFTGADYTAYFQTLHRDKLEVSFELEADRMRGLTLPEAEFQKERQVVIEERRLRTEDNPNALLYEQVQAAAFMSHPYHHPIIGWKADLESLKISDLRTWYNRWYQPNNATLVVAGDVDPEAVLKLAEKYFGPLPAVEVEPPRALREVQQQGERRIKLHRPAKVPALIMASHVPTLSPDNPDDTEPYALAVLAGILSGGQSARFASRLERGQELAAGVSAGVDTTGRGITLFTISGTPATGVELGQLEAAIRKEITTLQQETVSSDELQRVKTQVIAADVFGRDSLFYQAMRIGTLATLGLDWRLADQYVDRIKAVTPEQVQAVAKKYLTPQSWTIGELHPLDADKPAGRSPELPS